MITIEYLEDERKKLWEAVTELKKNLKNKSSESEREAKQASRKISEYKNKSLNTKEQIDSALATAMDNLLKLNEIYSVSTEKSASIDQAFKKANTFGERVAVLEQKRILIKPC